MRQRIDVFMKKIKTDNSLGDVVRPIVNFQFFGLDINNVYVVVGIINKNFMTAHATLPTSLNIDVLRCLNTKTLEIITMFPNEILTVFCQRTPNIDVMTSV